MHIWMGFDGISNGYFQGTKSYLMCVTMGFDGV